jgi:eukaryotic-like serine/threonine-protein kinase
MADGLRCPTCGDELPVNAPQRLCPACLLEQALESGSASRPSLPLSGDSGHTETATAGEGAGHQQGAATDQAKLTNQLSTVAVHGLGSHEMVQHTIVGLDGQVAPQAAAGRYQILGEIGRGGMGSVHRCRDTGLRRQLAFKVMLSEHRDRSDLVSRFIEEAQIGGQLQHPGIVPVYDLGTLPDRRPFFTMKLVDGQTLAALLSAREHSSTDLPHFLGVFGQVCQTMAFAHAHGVIHRDLKPSNIMVGSFGEVQVMDWGLAKVLRFGRESGADGMPREVIRTIRTDSEADASRAGSIHGTLSYMPPEQARGEIDRIDVRADVFSLGAILCEILTGDPPYLGANLNQVHLMAAQAELDDARARLDRSDADPELCDLARRCLAASREDRPRDAGDVSEAVMAHQRGVQERLRRAELARVDADARAEEEAKRRVLADELASEARGRAAAERWRRRMAVGLMASLMALVSFSVLGMSWFERKRRERAGEVDVAAEKAAWLVQAARDALEDSSRLTAARGAVEQLAAMAGDARDAAARARISQLVRAVALLESDRTTIEKLADIRSMSLDDPDGLATEAGYSDALIAAGLRVFDQTPEEVGAAIRIRPPTVAEALTAALDDWAAVLRDRYGQANQPSAGAPGPVPSADPFGWFGLFGTGSPSPTGGFMIPSAQDMQRHANLELLESLEPALGLAQAGNLTSMARAADPDTWRNQLRVALELENRDQRSKALLRIARDEKIADRAAVGLDFLGRALFDLDNVPAAEDVLRAGLKRHPRDLWLNYDLGVVLRSDGRRREAVVYLTAARVVRPEVSHELGHALDSLWERPEAAISVFEDLTRLRPQRPRHWLCLAAALRARGLEAEAVESEKKALKSARDAIDRDPDNAEAHHTLGVLLNRFGIVPGGKEAVTELLTASRLRPGDASIDLDLHEASFLAGAFAGVNRSELEFLRGLTTLDRLSPEPVKAALANATQMSNLKRPRCDLDAVREARKRLQSELRLIEDARSRAKSPFDEVFKEAKSWDWSMMGDLGIGYLRQRTLRRKSRGTLHGHSGRSGYSAAPLHELIERRPEDAEPHAELAALLMSDGKIEEAMAEFRRALDLEPPDSPLAVEAARRLADAERHALLAERLPRVISGEEQPDGGEDYLSYADFACGRRLYAAAVRLYERAMADDPKIFDPRSSDHRFRAACAAAQAGCDLGFDQPAPDDAGRARLRAEALAWLKADLAAWSDAIAGDESAERDRALDALSRWKSSPNLEEVRGPSRLSRLRLSEQAEWRAFWNEVDTLISKAQSRRKVQ